MLSFARASVLTFDCYGTLIDWERGIVEALRGVLTNRGIEVDDETLLARFGAHESPFQHGPFKRYREVLSLTTAAVCRDLGFEPTEPERNRLSASLPDWEPFPDTVAALRQLSTRFRLGIISNVDDDLFAASARRLGVSFDWVVTAEQVGSYKPSMANFHRALERIARPPEEIVHCAQSVFHDIAPAKALGLATVWVDRRGGTPGGATPPSTAMPDLTVPDLATLARIALSPGRGR